MVANTANESKRAAIRVKVQGDVINSDYQLEMTVGELRLIWIATALGRRNLGCAPSDV